jgi:hypothetical protein
MSSHDNKIEQVTSETVTFEKMTFEQVTYQQASLELKHCLNTAWSHSDAIPANRKQTIHDMNNTVLQTIADWKQILFQSKVQMN